MNPLRYSLSSRLLVPSLLFLSATAATAQARVSIGINLSLFPDLVPVPGYPVYYAPGVDSNYFFYDGMYWVYQGDDWYSSSWYNGPWNRMSPEYVPFFVLRIPVRYYRRPPVYFSGWQRDDPPHWGDHWGRSWEQRRHGWDKWDHHSAPAPAPIPAYQRGYSGDRYPGVKRQQELHHREYSNQLQDHDGRNESGPSEAPTPPRQRGGQDSRQQDQAGPHSGPTRGREQNPSEHAPQREEDRPHQRGEDRPDRPR